MEISKRIKERRIELGLSVDDLAARLGKNRATVYRYESGDIENLPLTILEPIAKALHTTPAYLMGWDIPDPIPVTSVRMIPVIGAVYAGAGGIAQLDYQGEEPTYNFTANGDFYYFIVKGDSMMPDIHPGDLALVRLQDEVECGEQAETFYPKRDMRNLMSQMAKHAIENNYFDKNYAQYIKLPEMAFITGIHTVLPSRSNASLSLRKERS